MTFQFLHRCQMACLCLMVVLLVSCQDDGLAPRPTSGSPAQITATEETNSATANTPVIKLFSPISGYVATPQEMGTVVTIHGRNFGLLPHLNVVRFNGVLANVIQCTGDEIVTEVPARATTGRITVTVNGVIVVSQENFTVTPPTAPVIYGFTPASGTPPAGTLPGTTVIISGVNFHPKPVLNEVKFNGVSAAVVNGSEGQLTVLVPAGATTGRITVTANGFTVSSATDFLVNTVSVPAIHGFAPLSGAPGTVVTISGNNFNPTPAGNVVKFNGVTALVSSASANQLKVTVPAGATTGTITVTVGGLTANSPTHFTVPATSTPVINSFFPRFVPQSQVETGQVIITIFGSNFSLIPSDNHVFFVSGGPGHVMFATPTELHVRVPVGTVSGPIILNINGQTAFSPYPLTVDPFN